MRQVLQVFCAGLLGMTAYAISPNAALAAPISQTPQIGKSVNGDHLLHNTDGYYSGRRYYPDHRDDDYEDEDENACGDCEDDEREIHAAPPPPPPAPPPPPPPPPYKPRPHKPHNYVPHHYEPPHYKQPRSKWKSGWTSDGKPIWRSDRFTSEFCYMCLGTCKGPGSCAPRCWGWQRHCHKHGL